MNETASIKRALMLVVIGLVIEAFCTALVTPGTFIVFVGLGLPLILAGVILYLLTVLRVLKRTRGL